MSIDETRLATRESGATICDMLAFVILLAAQVSLPQQPTPNAVDDPSWLAWRDHLAPGSDENLWQTIEWQDSILDGLQVAERTDRPLLLWLMNGHPLGCT
jgi:hypothetical protein